MPDLHARGLTDRGRRAITLAAVLAGVLLLLAAGTLFGPEAPASNANRAPLVGRTTTICTMSATTKGEPDEKTDVSAVAIQEAPDRPGLLTGSTLDSKPTGLKITQQGKGEQVGVTASMVIAGDGAMATTSSAVIVGDVDKGQDAGLKAAPCLAPAILHWFSGLGATDEDDTNLILTNPDDAEAKVDLRLYGPTGRMAAQGGAGLVISAHESRPVSLRSLVPAGGPVSVAVQATQGRVTAVAKRTHTDQTKPAGVDWQIPSASPSPVVLIPGIPADAAQRQLVVTNPSNSRATVGVQVLGFQGAYEPSGADSLEVPPESTATVNLPEALVGEAASIKLTSDVPVTGAVISTSQARGTAADIAIQSAAVPLIGTGVSPLATSNIANTHGELVVSNAGEADAQVTFEVFSYAGVRLRTADMVLGANTTASRRLSSPAPSYVVVKVPDGSSVFGDVVLTQPGRREVSGLATIPIGSLDLASRAPATRPDYSV
ncbi:MAG TPA: DUF5719 family protein, partial [Propionibacteriaceae bacterium]|nr:DUF5719 family protein [Propionibacteriaceae bacterium]